MTEQLMGNMPGLQRGKEAMSDVLEGYRMSEVGIIPDDWEVKRLGAAADVVMGQSPVGTSYNQSGTGAPLINGPTEFTEKYPIKIQWTSQPTKFCKKGDVLLCVRGSSTGRINISDDEYCIGRGVAAIRAKSCADTSFITFQVDSAVRSILALTTGSTFPNIDGKSIRAIQFPFPPLPEQQAIASALSDVDALIAALEQLITKKRNIKQGAMQQLLTGEKRLPGFVGAWEVKELHYLCNCINDGTHHTPKYVDDGVPFYSVENVTANNFSDTKFISQSAHNELIKRCKPEKGDILLTRIGTLGETKLIDWNVNASIYVSLALLKINDQIDTNYIYRYTKSRQFVKDIKKRSLLNAVPQKINMGDIGNVQINFPPTIKEQTAIAQILSDMDTEIEALKQKRDKYKAIKQGMMQELLTGKTRLV